MKDEVLRVALEDSPDVEARRSGPKRAAWTVVYAPGAGSNIHDPFGKYLSERLAAEKIECVRFQFPYMEERKKRPDRPAVLEATWHAVIDAIRRPRTKLCVGGRSMGGRIGSQVAATGVAVDAISLFAYPLHPPGKPERMRDAHFKDLDTPVLFCCGDRDAFGSVEETAALVKSMPQATHHVLAGADHGFSVRKSDGRTREDVWDEAVDTLVSWLAGLG
jgi:predicted alpha/beta-hydrolase family hydrolase